MAITLLGHQPIDFTYSENGECENLSDMCLHYETTDNPMFQIKASDNSVPLVTIQGIGETDFDQVSISPISQGNGFFTYQLNFEELGITDGCFEICVYEGSQSSGNLVTNGTFGSSLTGWITADGLVLDIASQINPSDNITCDGEIELIATGGTTTYTYSINGVTYQVSDTFTGLCYGNQYTFYVKDSYGVIRSIEFEFQDCTTFAGSDAFDIKDIRAFEIKNCEAFDFV